jgi:hypothetical protein
VRYPLREEVIPAGSIVRMAAPPRAMLGYLNDEPLLRLRDGRRIVFAGFDGGVGELAYTLAAWHRRALEEE